MHASAVPDCLIRPRTQWLIQRASAAFLLGMAVAGFRADAAALLATTRPPSGAIEITLVHGCVFVLGALLWRAQPSVRWHRTAMTFHVLLAFTTLVFWPTLAAADSRWLGYLTLVLHVVFAELQLYATTAAGLPRVGSVYRPPAAEAITPRRDFVRPVVPPLGAVPVGPGSSHRAELRSPAGR